MRTSHRLALFSLPLLVTRLYAGDIDLKMSTGNVSFKDASGTEKASMDPSGNFNFSGALMPGNLPGSAGHLLQSQGAGTAPVWVSPLSLSGYILNQNTLQAGATFYVSSGTITTLRVGTISGNGSSLTSLNPANLSAGTAGINISGNAVTATTATWTSHLFAGASGQVPYQFGVNQTTFTTSGTDGNVLTLLAGIPTWSAPAGGGSGGGNVYGSGLQNRVAKFNINGSTITSSAIMDLAVSEAIRIDASSRVGIGTTAPATTLDVNGTSQFGSTTRSTFTATGALNMASNTDLTVSGTGKVRGLTAAPTFNDEAASKAYVDVATAAVASSSGNNNYIQNRSTLQSGATFYVSSGTVNALTVGTISGNGSGLTNLNASNITSGMLALARGGTGSSLSASNGSIVYSDVTGMQMSAVGTNGYLLRSGGAGAPTWIDPTTITVATATYALTAGTATFATNAGSAITASSATYAITSSSANYAITSSSANYALTSSSANFATTSSSATWSTNLTGGTSGAVAYQFNINRTTFTASGSNGQVLALSGGIPVWTSISTGGGNVFGSGTQNRVAKFQVNGSTVTDGSIVDLGSTEAMRIDAAQNVGFGSGVAKSTFSSTGALTMASNTDLTITGTGKVRGLTAAPTFSDEAASKAYVDQATSTLSTTWRLTGNTGTTGANFLGTTDASGLSFRTNNSTAVYISSSAMVGIGTTSPGNTLHVFGGKGYIESTNSSYGQLQIGNTLANSSNSEASISFISGETSLGTSPTSIFGDSHIWIIGPAVWGLNGGQFGISNKGAGDSLLTIDSTGNVGIGTNTIGSKLDVVGNIRSGSGQNTWMGNMPTYGNALSTWWREGASDYSFATNGTSTFVQAPTAGGHIYLRSAGNTSLYVEGTTGRIGIGTIAPLGPLHVGIASFTVLSNGNVGIGSIAPSQILDVAGNMKFSGALMPGNDPGSAGSVLVSSGTGLAPVWRSTTSVFGSGGGASGWSLTGNSGTTGANFLGTTDSQALSFRTNSSTRVYVSASGLVGISNESPAYTLDVRGVINSTASFNLDGTPWLSDGNVAQTTLVGATGNTLNSGTGNTFVGYIAGADNTTGTSNTFIGTTSGNDNLSGTGNTFVGASSGRKEQSGSNNTFLGVSAGFNTTSGDTNIFLGHRSAFTHLSGSSNIAIGSDSGANLQTGSSNIFLGESAGFLGATQHTNAVAIGPLATVDADNAMVLGGMGSYALNVGIGTTVPAATFHVHPASFVVTSAGNVGVSKLSPTEKLDVAGNMRFSGALMPNNDPGTLGWVLVSSGTGLAPVWRSTTSLFGAGGGGSGWSLTGNSGTTGANFLGTTDSQPLAFRTNGSTRVYVSTGGLVGIGTSTPQDQLNIRSNAYSGMYINTIPNNGLGLSVGSSNDSYITNNAYFDGSNWYRRNKLNSAQKIEFESGGDITLSNVVSSFNPLISSWPEVIRILGDGSGYVGIGTAAPTQQLEISQNMKLPVAVSDTNGNLFFGGNPVLGQNGLRLFNLDSVSGSYIDSRVSSATKGIVFRVDTTSGSTERMRIQADGTVVIGGGSGKLDAGTVDPPYTINGEKYATYMMSGIGVKEELAGVWQLEKSNRQDNLYQLKLDLLKQPKGSDLWLFSKVTNQKKHFNELAILLSPAFKGDVWYEKDPLLHQLTIFAEPAVNRAERKTIEVSYRLIAPRFDAAKWSSHGEANAPAGLIINDPD